MMCSYSRSINLPWPATGKDKQAYIGRCIVKASYKFMSVKLAMQKANTTIFVSFRLVSVHARIQKVLSEGRQLCNSDNVCFDFSFSFYEKKEDPNTTESG